jgi:hypothetical protein
VATYSRAKIRAFVEASRDKSLSTTGRGMAFQELFTYMLGKVPGIRSRPNTIDPFQSEEIDVAVANTDSTNGLACFPNLFLVECKNWDAPVDAPSVAVFINKLANRYVQLGILVAANGITGDLRSLRAAQHTVAVAQGRGHRVLVVTLEDLCSVKTSEQLVSLLVDRLLELIASTAFLS